MSVRAQRASVIGGVLLQRATTNSAYATASLAANAFEDITGLSITFTAGIRPIKIRAGGWPTTQASAIGVRPEIRITDGSNVRQACSIGLAAATGIQPAPLPPVEFMLNGTPGQSYTFKVRVGNSSGAGASGIVTLAMAADALAFIEALEV